MEKQDKKPELTYTQIQEPLTIRRSVLEAALYSAEILKSYENLKKIHAEKDAYKKKLKTIIANIKILNSRITEELPELPQEERPQPVKKPEPIKPLKVEIKIPIKKKLMQPVAKSGLDLELEDIKSKLENLRI